MDWRGGWEDKGALIAIEFAVRQPKGITGEDAFCAGFENTKVMFGVPRRVKKEELTRPKLDELTVGGTDDALGIDGHQLAV